MPHRFIYGVLGGTGFLLLMLFGVAGSYARMAAKVSNYNNLRHEADVLRSRYENLNQQYKQTNEQLASLQLLATEVAAAYGVRNRLTGSADLVQEAPLLPTVGESLAEFNYLRTTNFSKRNQSIFVRSLPNVLPGVWPIDGRIMGGFGQRSDPFSGEAAVHSGVDISAPIGTPVHVTADGVVLRAGWNAGYGRCVIVEHSNGYQTWYGHLSRIDVSEGQEIRQGETLGAVGMSGRSTGPHLHYEVRIRNTPVNPYRFLAKASTVRKSGPAFPF